MITSVAAKIEETTPRVAANGADLPQDWLRRLRLLRVERGLCIVGRAVLRFNDDGYALSTQTIFPLGAKVTIKSGTKALFTGVVTGASLEQTAGGHPELVVVVDDGGCKLGMGTPDNAAKTYLNVSYGDVISQLALRGGLTASSDSQALGTDVHEYLLQSGSDLAFLDAITRRTGTVWWVDDTTLHVAAAKSTATPVAVTLTEDLHEFSVRTSGLRPTKVTARGWDPKTQQDVVGVTTTATATTQSDFVDGYLGTKPSVLASDPQQVAGAGNPNTQAEADALAGAMLTDWQAGAVVARGTGDVNAAIVPLGKVKVANAGPASGTYTVSEVEHVYRPSAFETRFVAGPLRPAGLVDTLGPAAADPGFSMPGLMPAIVTDNNNNEHPGEVQIKYAGSGDVVGPWARVVSLGGGGQRGIVFHPEVSDEVLVGFERGDTRHPVVIGGLYSDQKKIAADNKLVSNNSVAYRRITSRTGHVIELGDGTSPDQQYILLQLGTGAKHKLRLGADRFDIEVAGGKPVLIKAGQAKFEVTAAGDVSITGNNVTITANQNLSLEGKIKAEMKGVETSVQGTAKIDVKGGLGNVEASGPLALKGAVVAIN